MSLTPGARVRVLLEVRRGTAWLDGVILEAPRELTAEWLDGYSREGKRRAFKLVRVRLTAGAAAEDLDVAVERVEALPTAQRRRRGHRGRTTPGLGSPDSPGISCVEAACDSRTDVFQEDPRLC